MTRDGVAVPGTQTGFFARGAPRSCLEETLMLRWANLLVAAAMILICRPFADAGNPPKPPGLSAAEIADGWISLFDGKSLFGWKPNSDLNWSVSDGVIRADSGHAGLLVTTFQLADYDFRCDYRLEKGGNSGIFLRTPFKPKDPTKDCYELNMCDSHPAFPTGSIVGRKKASGTFRGEGDWMTMEAHV